METGGGESNWDGGRRGPSTADTTPRGAPFGV